MYYIFFDASSLAKRYTPEIGTPLLHEVFSLIPFSRMTCSTVGMLEVISILVRKHNDGRLKRPLFDRAMSEYKAEVIANPAFLTVPANEPIINASIDLIPQHNINATDAIVLRSALNIQNALGIKDFIMMLWTSDKRLYRAAHNEGLLAFNPEKETIESLHLHLHVSSS